MKKQVWKQKIKNLPLKRKLLIFYSVLFVLPLLLISVVIYREVSRQITERLEYSAVQGFEQARSYLEYKILGYIQKTDSIVTNSNLKELIREECAADLSLHEQLALRSYLISYLQSMESSAQNISIQLYVSDAFRMLSDEEFIHYLSEADQSLWYQKKRTCKVYFAPSVYLEEEYRDCVALVRDISSSENYQLRNSVLRVLIDLKELEEILVNATATEHGATYLVNRENLVVSVSDPENFQSLGLSDTLPETLRYSLYGQDAALEKTSLDGKAVYCMRRKIRNTDWEMITLLPAADMTGEIGRLQTMVAGLMLSFGLLTITGGAVLISWIVRRISVLNDSFNQVKCGNTQAYLPNETKDEIGLLYDNYNSMLRHTNQLMEEQYQLALHLKNAELKALQSQINPHFLYNTLDLINWLAYGGKTDMIHTAVISLSKYYRLVLNKGRDTLSLREELLHVSYYIKIQDIRYPGRLQYEETVPEELKDCAVPKIILQPLVENAILHGIWEKKDKRGSIRIRGRQEAGSVFLDVEDDGRGMDEETLRRIQSGKIPSSGSGYGVRNVHARLQLMFGAEYGLTFQSKEGLGTCVTVKIPK
ncbi:MAG TPA: sensor histidine kinase [Candidatus Limivivens intestinipullorum]|uniref:histidine kinase n=1 Tax=Candidatus Limivivens intestinipullorum TaxID=2840858 RepID=A0A9D1EV46_9FIRM|nr:sensor histidine kinase [Candidatus Limivivens intestinipullorum]